MEENYEEQDQNSLIKNQELVEYPKKIGKIKQMGHPSRSLKTSL
jgi:hypothetical protein